MNYLPNIARTGKVLLLAAALSAGCGGPDKKETTTPTNPGPTTKAPPPTDPSANGTDDPTGDPGEGSEPSGTPGPSQGGLQPPGLDLTPEQKKARVSEHVMRGKNALGSKGRNPDTAITEARAALLVDETSVDAMLILAHANYMKGYLDLAEDILEKAEKRGGGDRKELHFLRGLIYERTERADEALNAFQRATTIDPDYRSGLLNLGVQYLRNKRYEQAVQLYERLTGSLKYNGAPAWTNLASAYRGRSAEVAKSDPKARNEYLLKAEATYKKAGSLDKTYAPAVYNLGLLYLDADPFPSGNGDMDKLARLKMAKGLFDQYRGMAGANTAIADEQAGLAQKLYDREDNARKKAEEAARRRKEADKKAKEQPTDSNEGFE